MGLDDERGKAKAAFSWNRLPDAKRHDEDRKAKRETVVRELAETAQERIENLTLQRLNNFKPTIDRQHPLSPETHRALARQEISDQDKATLEAFDRETIAERLQMQRKHERLDREKADRERE